MTGRASFDLAWSGRLRADEIATALRAWLPSGLRIEVGLDVAEMTAIPGDFRAVLHATDDAGWPGMLTCHCCQPSCGLGDYPDLALATLLGQRFGVNVLCDVYPFAGELDPHDPYYGLALTNGAWHLASTAGMRLMGAGTEGTLRLIRPVTLPLGALPAWIMRNARE